ncbi:FAD-dependent oxidoreductase [Porticoccaceae bacterium]|nr:FAD-dependent oxidoreductase [Porticoccaceae bacterium]
MSNSSPQVIDTLIIGSGLAGLSAASRLSAQGLSVTVIDKGRGVGGRLAARRIGDAVFDHGAQFFTARSEQFKICVNQWIKSGVAEQWYQSYPGQPNGHPRYRGVPTMVSVAKHLAKDQTVIQSTRALELNHDGCNWIVKLEPEEPIIARSVIITSPVPQTLDLLDKGNSQLTSGIIERLQKIQYESCIAVMAVLDAPSSLEDPGALAIDEGPIAWISDNHKKGASPLPALTIHASGEFSQANFNRDRNEVGKELIELARPLFGSAPVSDFQVHGWLYSKPTTTDDEASFLLSESLEMPTLVLAGDAFAGPRFEGAVLSGWSAAEQIKDVL